MRLLDRNRILYVAQHGEERFESRYESVVFVGLSAMAVSVVFAVLITVIGVATGFSVTGGAEGVGRATTRAVVLSITALIVADMVFSFFRNR